MNQISESNYDLLKDYKIDMKQNNEESGDDNQSIINTINKLNVNDNTETITEKENEEYIKNLLDNFDDKIEPDSENNKESNIEDYEDDLSKYIKAHLKTLNFYRKEVIEKYNDYENNKEEIDKLVEEMKNNKLREFSGNENIFLDQQKENGECLDYAVLFGDKNNKTFVSFQMKCFGRKSQINVNALNKIYIKDKMKNILINAKGLFNCKINKWYYFLVFYYNKNDIENNNISIKFLQATYNSDIEFIFYNPEEHKFYNNIDGEIMELKLTNKADLDYNNNQIFNRINFKYKDNPNDYNAEAKYFECIEKFIQDLGFLDEDKQNPLNTILNKISKIVEKDGLYFETCLDYKNGIIDYPEKNKIFLYKNKKNNFIAITHKNDHLIEEKPIFQYYNINDKKRLKTFNANQILIGYYYCLSVKNAMVPRKKKPKMKLKFDNPPFPKPLEKFIPLKMYK